MTAPTTEEPVPNSAPDEKRRRRPAPPAHPFFRFVFPLLVAGVGVAVFLLWLDGARAVLDTTDGEAISVVDDPTEPGFLAFTTPTPTLLVAHVDANDTLIGVTVLARTLLDEGGTLVLFSPAMLVDLADDAVVLSVRYANEGIEGLEAAIGEYMGFGFTDDPMIMDTERFATFLERVEPIQYFLPDALVRVDGDGNQEAVYESGVAEFSGADLAEVYQWRNPTEFDAARYTRQLAIWEAWLVQLGGVDDIIDATLPFDEGLPPYLRSLATGTADLKVVPAVPVVFGSQDPLYAIAPGRESWPREQGQEMVPLPVGYAGAAWPTVKLLDGTGEAGNRAAFLRPLATAGAEIAVIGNATAFGVEETFVAYHAVVDEERGVALANALGVPVRFEEDLDQPAQLTVTVGADFVDVIESTSG